MNNYTNKHLNVFQAFSQKGLLPIENNISRGLAILFQEEPALTMMFLNILKQRFSGNAEDLKEFILDDEYEVYFQRSIDAEEFQYSSKILGVALTATELEDSNGQFYEETDDKKYITDISIAFSQYLIVIEVKRTDEDCRKQLYDQINQIIVKNDSKEDVRWIGTVSLTWRDIVKVLNDYCLVKNSNVGRLVEDYRNFLLNNFPSWNVIEHIDRLNKDDNERIKQRLFQLQQEYIADAAKRGVSVIWTNHDNVAIDGCDYVKEYKLYYHQHRLYFAVWLGDNANQGYSLYSPEVYEDFIKFYNDEREKKDFEIECCPYVKLAHIQGRWVYSLEKKDKWEDLQEWRMYAKELCGKMERGNDSWEKMINHLNEREEWWEEKPNDVIEEYFCNKSFAFLSHGIRMSLSIPFESAKQIDSEQGGLLKYVKDLVCKVTSWGKR